MTTILKKLRPQTIFKLDGQKWQVGGSSWGHPTLQSGAPKEIVGKPCLECYPMYGGQFQHELPKWIPEATEVIIEIN